MEKIKNFLRKFGLTNSEIVVYLAGLSMGPSLASSISKKTKIGRSMVYHLIEALREKGLVSSIGPSHGKKFEMEQPTRLKTILSRRKKELEKIEENLENITVELESLNSDKYKPARIQFFEGEEGMKNVAEDTLVLKDKEQYVIASIDSLLSSFSRDYLENYLSLCDKKKISRRSVWSKSLAEADVNESEYRKQRVAPVGCVFPSTIFMYDDKVAVFSSEQEKAAFVVESEEFSRTMKMLFGQLWKVSK